MTAKRPEEKKDELTATDEQIAAALKAAQLASRGEQLLTRTQDLLTPKGKAEADLVELSADAKETLKHLLKFRGGPERGQGEVFRTQLAAAQYVFDAMRQMVVSNAPGKKADRLLAQLQGESLGAELSRRLAQRHGQGARAERARIVEAVPATASTEHTSVSEVKAQTLTTGDAADGDGGGQG